MEITRVYETLVPGSTPGKHTDEVKEIYNSHSEKDVVVGADKLFEVTNDDDRISTCGVSGNMHPIGRRVVGSNPTVSLHLLWIGWV